MLQILLLGFMAVIALPIACLIIYGIMQGIIQCIGAMAPRP